MSIASVRSKSARPSATAIRIAAAVMILVSPASAARPRPSAARDGVSGRWRAVTQVGGAEVPFDLEISRSGAKVRVAFFDGARRANPSEPGSLRDGRLEVTFPSYAARLDAVVAAGRLDGVYTVPGHQYPVRASLGGPGRRAEAGAPTIAGEWLIPYKSAKGESAWRLILRQTGSDVQGAILRIDGDTGTLSGGFANGRFLLSHFAGERAARLEITPQGADQLRLVLTDTSGRREFVAVRPGSADAGGAAPSDPALHTRVADPGARFHFAFRDLSGRLVSDADPRFHRKVVLVNVMGSWCPNCHDEAPFLEALYERRRAEGLEIVALDFEQADQLADPQRLRAFIHRYNISYPVLLVGAPSEVNAKIPQAVNLNAWPTTFFLGRDGRVKRVHVGFTSPGSGPRDAETRVAVEREVETLLSSR